MTEHWVQVYSNLKEFNYISGLPILEPVLKLALPISSHTIYSNSLPLPSLTFYGPPPVRHEVLGTLISSLITGWDPKASTSCKNTWDTVRYLGLNGLSMILCLWSLLPLTKLLAIPEYAKTWSNIYGGEGGGVLYLTDLWLAAICSKKGPFFVKMSQHFCNCLLLAGKFPFITSN